MNTLLQYLLIDAVLSLVVFGLLYYFRKDILIRLRTRLRSFLGIDSVESRVSEVEEEVYDELKPEMKRAMDEVFGYE